VLGDILQIPKSELGAASGNLAFYDQLVCIPLVYIWGVLSDRIGRNVVYSIGYLLIGTAFFIYTRAANLYPQLIAFRVVFAFGAAAASSMITAVVSDMTELESRGKVSGLVGIFSGIGALLGLFIFLPLPAKFTNMVQGLHITYIIVGSVALLFSGVLFFAIKKKKISTQNSTDASQETVVPEKAVVDIVKEGFKSSTDPTILLSYFGSFLARGDTIIITTFIPLLVYKHYITGHTCSGDVHGNLKENCRDAYILSSVLSGIAQTFALAGAPFFGILCDKIYKPLCILIAGILQ
jgi:MFS family permease